MRAVIAVKRFWVKSVLRKPLPLSLVHRDYVCPLELECLGSVASDSGKIVCNINFDDLCPRYDGQDGLDFGGDPAQGLSADFSALLARFPNVAVTIFMVPVSRIRIARAARFRDPDYLRISEPRHAEWLAHYKDLSSRYTLEFALHGCYHRQYENRMFGSHTEFAFKSERECASAIDDGLQVFRDAGLSCVGFRQPGWDLNSDLSICAVLKRKGFSYFAASSEDGGLNAGCQRVSNEYPALVGGLLHFPQNILIDWELATTVARIRSIAERRGIISIKAHYVNRGMTNSLCRANLEKLYAILAHLETHYNNRIEYLTFRDLAARLTAVKSGEGTAST